MTLSATNTVYSYNIADASIQFISHGSRDRQPEQGLVHQGLGQDVPLLRFDMRRLLLSAHFRRAPGRRAGPARPRASRIKDLAMIAGARDNQLAGYGLVAGLAGDGDKNPVDTIQTIGQHVAALRPDGSDCHPHRQERRDRDGDGRHSRFLEARRRDWT